MTEQLHLGVALDGYGWHPRGMAATADAEPVTSGRYWSELATTAERGLLDFVTFDDSLTPQRRRRQEIEPRWLAGRPDAVLVAARVAPVTTPHRADPRRDRHPHRAVPCLQSHCHA